MLHFMAVASLEWVLNIKENVLPRLVPKEEELVKLKPKNPVIENVDNIDNKVAEKNQLMYHYHLFHLLVFLCYYC